MNINLGDLAPNFRAISTLGILDFHEWLGDSWGLLFSHPEDYTPVCTTELGVVANLKAEFAKRNVKAIAISVDDLESHVGWIKDIEETIGAKVDFPILADEKKEIVSLYGMLNDNSKNNFTVRSVFIIGPDKKIRLTINYPVAVGRNFDEILRVIDALQLNENYQVLTPANWQYNDQVIIDPNIPKDELDERFPKGFQEVKPYLKYTPQPG
ncbi:peroxiredoxin [Fulvivirgaceae bacterium BMA10]|uniref:Peroxiredoxin n=1 Tax=Splendidivirga corallicola TaxID=3051826 RepID=A0ABT8KL57_9BACT|nr:peroxiredoxin [Fulvivirgaceae bacterium BMA10]